MQPKVSIIMGSTSDLKIMSEAAKFLDEMNIPFEINALSAHRTPDLVLDFAKKAHTRGVKVIIAGAGGAAHLPGVIAALTPLPVVGVPIKSSNSIDGLGQHPLDSPDAFGDSRGYGGARWSQERRYSRHADYRDRRTRNPRKDAEVQSRTGR